MTNNEKKALEAIQLSYFDICDLLNGNNTYKSLGYDNRTDFLLILRDRLAEIENRLFPQVEEA
jgi:hypothetical protein